MVTPRSDVGFAIITTVGTVHLDIGVNLIIGVHSVTNMVMERSTAGEQLARSIEVTTITTIIITMAAPSLIGIRKKKW